MPANFGRVRATCVEDGITMSGQSDFFTIPANGIVDVPDISFGQVAGIPESPVLTAPVNTLQTQGRTTQIMVTASYSDGEDISAGEDGFITSPGLADSDGDGLNDGTEVVLGSDPGRRKH